MSKGYRLTASTGIHKGDREYQQDQIALLSHPRITGCVLGVVADGMYIADGDVEDFAPDFEFDAASKRLPDGYSVEIRLPFLALRYPLRGGAPAGRWAPTHGHAAIPTAWSLPAPCPEWSSWREALLDQPLRDLIVDRTSSAPEGISLLRRIDVVVWMRNRPRRKSNDA